MSGGCLQKAQKTKRIRRGLKIRTLCPNLCLNNWPFLKLSPPKMSANKCSRWKIPEWQIKKVVLGLRIFLFSGRPRAKKEDLENAL